MATLYCVTCGVRDASLFYPGKTKWCKEHWKAKVRADRAANLNYYREYDRARASMPHRVAARKAYQATPAGKARADAAKRKWAELNRHKRQASFDLNNAIKYGRVQSQPCLVCGDVAEAHHPSYDLPLAVVWLCDKHHKQVHKEARQYERELETC
jgi:hypothetical protein